MNNQSTLVGLFKETYGANVIEAWGYKAKLASRIPFVSRDLMPGNYYHQPVDIQFEQGISYAAPGTTIGSSGSVFFPSSAGQLQDAQIAGGQILARAQVSYDAIAKSANDKAAFQRATERVVRRLSQAALKRLEINLLHGQRGIGTVASLAAEAGSSGNYTTVVTLSDQTWSPGLWAAQKGAFIDLYQSDLATARQAANINTGVTSGTSGWCVVTNVDPANKAVTLNYGTARSGWVAGDVLFFGGSVGGASATEAAGIDAISRVASGTFWNVSATNYELWRGNQYNVAGAISFGKLLEAVGVMANYGLDDDVVAIIPPRAFDVLNTDLAALRQFDVSYTEANAKLGARNMKYFGQTGAIEIMPHPFQKEGLAHVIPPREMARIGSAELGFITRQGSEDKLILESATTAASEMRCYSNQSLFLELLRHSSALYGITY